MFYKKITFLLFSSLLCFHATTLLSFHGKSNDSHAIYIGVVQISHVQNRPTAHILIKIFQDDLQDALRHAFGLKIEKEIDFCVQHRQEIEQYFQRHLKGTINEKKMTLNFEKGEKQNNVYLLNFEIECPETWKSLAIKADFFMELFPAQSNILQVENGLEKRFGRLKKEEEEIRFDF